MLTIRRAVAGDVDTICDITRETWLDTYGSWYSEETQRRILAVWIYPPQLAAAIDNPAAFIAVASNESAKIVGVLSARIRDETRPWIARLYVLPTHQRRGCGTALVGALMAECPNAETLRLEVQVGNDKGLRYWQHQGFVKTGSREESVAGETMKLIEMEKRMVTDESRA
jgi:ribosomal protein S18 acetylase RimI-like enzyme